MAAQPRWCGRPKSKSLLGRFPDLRRDLDLAASLGRSLDQFYALDPEERELWQARWELEAETCPEHGGPRSECADPGKKWYPTRIVDWAEMERAGAEATYRRLHEKAPWHNGDFTSWSAEATDEHPYHFMHGVRIRVFPRDIDPDNRFLKGE